MKKANRNQIITAYVMSYVLIVGILIIVFDTPTKLCGLLCESSLSYQDALFLIYLPSVIYAVPIAGCYVFCVRLLKSIKKSIKKKICVICKKPIERKEIKFFFEVEAQYAHYECVSKHRRR